LATKGVVDYLVNIEEEDKNLLLLCWLPIPFEHFNDIMEKKAISP